MQKTKIIIAKKTLKLLEKKEWKNISLSSILGDYKNVNIKSKNDLLININRYFYYLLIQNLSTLEESTKKDMLFEILMARLDILNLYRKSIKKIIKYLFSNPQKFIVMAPSFIESIIQIATLSNIDVNGIKGIPKIKVILILYLLSVYSWHGDESNSLEKTMKDIDKYLSYIDPFVNSF